MRSIGFKLVFFRCLESGFALRCADPYCLALKPTFFCLFEGVAIIGFSNLRLICDLSKTL